MKFCGRKFYFNLVPSRVRPILSNLAFIVLLIGAFGTAVLYRRLSDSKMIVLKEINMGDLSAAERQMALNEVEVLSVLHHPNIIRYTGLKEKVEYSFYKRNILKVPSARHLIFLIL